jgi:hypothetical protein
MYELAPAAAAATISFVCVACGEAVESPQLARWLIGLAFLAAEAPWVDVGYRGCSGGRVRLCNSLRAKR